jgi:hypothetical protein
MAPYVTSFYEVERNLALRDREKDIVNENVLLHVVSLKF